MINTDVASRESFTNAAVSLTRRAGFGPTNLCLVASLALLLTCAVSPAMSQPATAQRATQGAAPAAGAPPAGAPGAAAGAPGKPPAPPPTPKAGAMIDLTGYWVSVVTEDWVYRMLTAPKGDAGSLPVTAEARKVAGVWDAAADKAASDSCKVNGAAGNIRRPGRLHITWSDEQNLRVDFTAGEQSRMLAFGPVAQPASMEHTLQGRSVAQWVRVRNWQQFAPPTIAPVGGTLKVVTTNMKAGYLQSNGFPYSENAKMTEYFDRVTYDGQPWLIVTTVIEDPVYLRDSLYWSTPFKQEKDGSHWKAKPCGA
jgi:hypothetical protein